MNKLTPLALLIRLCIPLLTYFPSKYLPPFDSSYLLLNINPLAGLKWDAIHYTSIALNGYQYEQHGAWMPLWPFIMRYAGWAMHYILGKTGDLGVEDVVRGGEVVNLSMNLASTYMIYKLTRELYPKKEFAEITTLFYILSPTPAPNASPYTETSYAFFTLCGFYMGCKRRWWGSALALGVATGLRGTGVFAVGVLAGLMLLDVRNFRFWGLINRAMLIGGLCGIVILPFVGFQWYTYMSFCLDERTIRPWCENRVPISYTFIQAEYWNVGFLKYWTPAQIPNLVIALPVLLPSLSGTYIYMRDLVSQYTSAGPVRSKQNTRHAARKADLRLLVIHLHSLHQTLLLIFSAHTQIALRTAITNPVIYWNLANLSFDWSGPPEKRKMGMWGKVWVGWSSLWGAIGIVLWSGHYPPA